MTTTENRVFLSETWTALFPGVTAPSDPQFALWLLLHDLATVKAGIAELAVKYRRLDGQMNPGWMAKFASSVMNRISREKKEIAQ
jgi:hypothetical protein